VDAAVSRDYQVEVETGRVALTKFRPVRWYPMQVVVDFDPSLVEGIAPAIEEHNKAQADTAIIADRGPSRPTTPPFIQILPALVGLVGLLALMLKGVHVRSVYAQLGRRSEYRLLSRTGFAARFFLSAAAVALGVAAEHMGSLAAGVVPLVVASALWLTRGATGGQSVRSGGEWRKMSEEDIIWYRRLLKAYRRSRRSVFDITTPGGVVSFMALMAGLGYVVLTAREIAPRVGTAAAMNGLILAIPAWFSGVAAELPMDPTLEGFATLGRWRRSVTRLVGSRLLGASAHLWVREDSGGPIEVRLRVETPGGEQIGRAHV